MQPILMVMMASCHSVQEYSTICLYFVFHRFHSYSSKIDQGAVTPLTRGRMTCVHVYTVYLRCTLHSYTDTYQCAYIYTTRNIHCTLHLQLKYHRQKYLYITKIWGIQVHKCIMLSGLGLISRFCIFNTKTKTKIQDPKANPKTKTKVRFFHGKLISR